MTVIEEVYQEILARKQAPKEGSYTSYLFEKGVDKILKKVGEEATEVVIAAKNEQAELISETSDLLYHLLVLLVGKDVSLEAIEQEMAGRIGKKSRIHDRKTVEDY